MKAFKIILIVLVVLGGSIYFAIWYSLRTTSEDISHLKPFSDVIGKELTTVQPSLIAVNTDHWLKQNTYIIMMKRSKLSGNVSQLEQLPVGSILKLKKAKRYTSGVTGFKSTYILGSLFLKELQKEVPFTFAWGEKNYGTDLPGDYFVYNLAPWQEKPLEVMYNYEQNLEVPIEKNLNQSNVLEK